jgi:hypothetical protein
MRNKKTRRDLLKYTAATGIGFWVSGRSTWADEVDLKSPSERINIASIGIGGKGDGDSDQAARHGNLIAICDIDDKRLNAKAQRYPKAEKFNDFRKMFDKLGKQIDAVTVSTPDHTHAVATMMAIKMGKAAYTQKPLTHDVWEARQLRLAAKEHNVATQMGNQGTAHRRLRNAGSGQGSSCLDRPADPLVAAIARHRSASRARSGSRFCPLGRMARHRPRAAVFTEVLPSP